MYKELTIVTDATPSQLDRNLLKISDFLGIPARLEEVKGLTPLQELSCVIVSADTLSRLDDDGARAIFESRRVFITGIDSSAEHGDALRAISGGRIQSVRSAESNAYSISSEDRDFCRQFTGLEFGVADGKNDRVFDLEEGGSVESLISIGGRPSLLKIQDSDREVFIAGSLGIVDLDRLVHRASEPLELFSQFVPVMMFIRYVFGDQCWHSERATACFTIDDPWLRRNYGYVEYGRLLEAMRRKSFTTSIAFIPWNFRRSRKDVVNQFHSNSEFLSLSVHGCDHNEGEFGVDDQGVLRHKIGTALHRMERHEELTGLPFDPVMVFPQGVFSEAALRSLEKFSFLAAVNSDPFAVDQAGEGIPLRCFLDTTMSHFEGVALFLRNYPFETANFALDLFLGKPALAVEHHEFFKNGYEELEEFVDRLHSMDEEIEWLTLGDVARQATMRRRTSKGVEIRSYTNECSVRNGDPEPVEIQAAIIKKGEGEIYEVTVQGKAVDFVEKDGRIQFDLSIGALASAEVKVVYEKAELAPDKYRPSYLERSKVAARRYLCDFRDNHLAKNELLLKCSKHAKRKFFNSSLASELK